MAVRKYMRCPECQGPMKLRPGKFGQFYACLRYPDCKGAHGAHPNGEPKGFPGNAATRAARILAHAAFDRLWQGGGMSRDAAYRWMQVALGMTKKQAHIGKFSEAECGALIAAVDRYTLGLAPNPKDS